MRVAVCGAAGRMGREVCRALSAESDMELVCAVDPAAAGKPLRELVPEAPGGLLVQESISVLPDTGAEALVDFTMAEAARQNIPRALEMGVHVVAGTTGLRSGDLEAFAELADKRGVACLIAPNFALGAVLMMRFAAIAARFLPDCEIIELHHPLKLDAPSGTASLTAEMIASARGEADDGSKGGKAPPSRGEDRGGVRVHSVRLPGLVAHQEVIFGGVGQTLTIRHDSLDRTSFMPGVIFALREAPRHPGLTVGLEKWMGL